MIPFLNSCKKYLFWELWAVHWMYFFSKEHFIDPSVNVLKFILQWIFDNIFNYKVADRTHENNVNGENIHKLTGACVEKSTSWK